MEMLFQCPHCNAEYQLPSAMADSEAECPDCGEIITIPPLRLGPGVIIGGFRLERHLGKGSMGDVYLATQLSMDRRVAVKLLPQAMTVVEESVNRFLHEVQTSAKMEHPNIVTAFDAGQDNGTYYLAMSYVEGENFDDIVRRDGPIPESQAVDVCISTAKGLKYAWNEYQLLHRDIKPGNIMMDRHGTIKLMDMGISKSIHEDASLTVPGLVVGTPHYMSPEQAWSDDPIDFRSDLYAVGATLYMLLTGRPPYVGSSQSVFTMLIRPEPFPDPKNLNPNLSDAMRGLILTCMAKDPDDRYQTWDELIDAARAVGAGQMPERSVPARTEEPAVIPPPPGGTTGSSTMNQTGTRGTVSLTLKKKGPGTHLGNKSDDSEIGGIRPLSAKALPVDGDDDASDETPSNHTDTVAAEPPAGSLLNNQGSRIRIEPKATAGSSKLSLRKDPKNFDDDDDDAGDEEPIKPAAAAAAGSATRMEPKVEPGASKLSLKKGGSSQADSAAPAATGSGSGEGSAARVEPKAAAGASKLSLKKGNESTNLPKPPEGIAATKAAATDDKKPPVAAAKGEKKGGLSVGKIIGPVIIVVLLAVGAVVYIGVTKFTEDDPGTDQVGGIPIDRPEDAKPPIDVPRIPDIPDPDDTPTEVVDEPPPKPQMTPEEIAAEKAEIARIIQQRLEAQLMSLQINRDRIARNLGLDIPVEAPNQTETQVREAVDPTARELAERKYPDRNVDIEARNRYGYIGIGDFIRVEHRDGGNIVTTDGLLRGITPTRLQIGDKIVSKDDIVNQETLSRLDQATADRKVMEYIQEERGKTDEKRKAYIASIEDRLAAELYRKAGYVQHNGEWVNPKELVDRAVEEETAKQRRQLEKRIENETYRQFGYGKKGGDWVKLQ